MKQRLVLFALALLALTPAAVALAKGPFNHLRITGPGLDSELEIEGEAALAFDMVDLMECCTPIDGPDLEPTSGYAIIRSYGEGGSYRPFDRVYYHPSTDGGPGYVYYDGIYNGTSEFDGQWFQANTVGETALRALLADSGVLLDAPAPASPLSPLVTWLGLDRWLAAFTS